MTNLLSITDLDRDELETLLALSEDFLHVTEREIPKVPALRGKVVVSLFYEDSTRTRISFETAAKRLSCDVMSFSVGSSSVNKGEGLRDTVQTIAAMGVDAVVVRHSAAGAGRELDRRQHHQRRRRQSRASNPGAARPAHPAALAGNGPRGAPSGDRR
jgi:aspartate carbamoyltransferase catalytic subunit